jgi:hypothetical protein
MSGYVASVRVVRASPRLAAGRRSDRIGSEVATVPAAGVAIVETAVDPGRWTSSLAERGRAFRDRWSQLTFFLFDPDSWRT